MAIRRVGVLGTAVVLLLASLQMAPAAAQDPGAPSADPLVADGLTPVLADYARGVDDIRPNADGRTTTADSSGVDVLTDGRRLLVEISVLDVAPATLDGIRQAGAEIRHVAEDYGVVSAYVSPEHLEALTRAPGVRALREAIAPIVNEDGSETQACATGIDSDADEQLRADVARADFDVDGSGVHVAVLSDSYSVHAGAPTTALADIASADLPGTGNPCGRTAPVSVLRDGPTSNVIDEGRAMLQHVHDLAPEATLSFGTAYNTPYEFADRIRALHAAGADVIVDDITYLNEPVFQQGPIDVAVSEVVAAGAVYLSSAANSNVVVGGRDVGSYEAPAFRPAPCPAGLPTGYSDCHDFNADAAVTDTQSDVTLQPSGNFALSMQWAEPWSAVTTDLDLYVLTANGVALASTNTNGAFVPSVPFERVSGRNGGVPLPLSIVVARRAGAAATPRVKLDFGRSNLSAVEYDQSTNGDIVGPTTFGHNASVDGLSVAATDIQDGMNPESFSSRGPVTHYFGPVRADNVPAAALPVPRALAKPDLTASDGACTTFFIGALDRGCYRFYGTSAAAPHAAAVVALIRDAAPDMTPAQIEALLEGTAAPMNGGATAVGAGLVDAHAALDALRPSGVVAVGGRRNATVTWSPPAHAPGTIAGYSLEVFSNGNSLRTLPLGDVTSTTVSDLPEGAGYTFVVTAVTASGSVLPSNPSTAVNVLSLSVPSAPTGVIGTAGNGEVAVSWSPPVDDGGSAINRYKIRVFEGAAEIAQKTATTTSAVVDGLTNGTAYTFTVAAENAQGEGAQSTPTGPVTPAVVPGAPTGVAAVPVAAGATVSWTAPAQTGGSPISGYRVRAFAGAVEVSSTAVGNVTSTPVTGLTNGTAYTFTVAAINGQGEGPQSAPSVAVTPSTVPGAPTAVQAVAGDRTATVSWTAPADTGGSAITGYRVRTLAGGVVVATTPTGAVTTAPITGLTNGTAYTFTVAAINSRGEGTQSLPSGVVTPVQPAGPGDVGGGGQVPSAPSVPTVPTPEPQTPTDPDDGGPTEPPISGNSLHLAPVGDGGGSDVSVELSQLAFPDDQRTYAQAGATEALLASEQVFADALASGSLQRDRPLLLTDPDELEAEILTELQRLGVSRVRILGGEQAVSADIADALTEAGYTVERTFGATRLETAAAIAALVDADEGFLARAFPSVAAPDPTQAFADALTLGGWAAATGGPILLSESQRLSTTTADVLSSGVIQALNVVGGEAAIAAEAAARAEELAPTVTRVAGLTRFATAVAVAGARGHTARTPADAVIVIEGQSPTAWTSGFTAGSLSARRDAPIVLANGDILPSETADFLATAVSADADVVCVASRAACDRVEEHVRRAG